MIDRLRRWLPTPQQAQSHRWLRWLGPALHHPRLWHLSRRGVALGVAIGIFFGLLIPIAQIPMSAVVAVALRANVPSAMASTLVTNPVTFPPVYYAAWKLGGWLLGEDTRGPAPVPAAVAPAADTSDTAAPAPWLVRTWRAVTGVGKPLLLGLAIFAVAGGLLVYALIQIGWAWRVRRKRRRRLQTVGA